MGTAICIIILDHTFNSYAYNMLPTVIQLTNTWDNKTKHFNYNLDVLMSKCAWLICYYE